MYIRPTFGNEKLHDEFRGEVTPGTLNDQFTSAVYSLGNETPNDIIEGGF